MGHASYVLSTSGALASRYLLQSPMVPDSEAEGGSRMATDLDAPMLKFLKW